MAIWTFKERRLFITAVLVVLVLNAFGFDLFGFLDFSIFGIMLVGTVFAWLGVWIIVLYFTHKLA